MSDNCLKDGLREGGNSKEFSASGIFWILLDTGRFKAFTRFVANQHGIFGGINREQGRHESVDITFRYAHMFPTEQIQMAELLNAEFKEGTEE